MGRASRTRRPKDVSDSRSTATTSASTASGAVLHTADEAGTRTTQSPSGIIWQVRAKPSAASSSVSDSSMKNSS